MALLLAGCASSSDRAPGEGSNAPPPPPAPAPKPIVLPAAPPAPDVRAPLLAPRTQRSWDAVRRQAAERLVAANPDFTYMGKVPDQLLAIPVLEIELNGDGSVRRIEVLRAPRQAKETMNIAIDSIRRAAPYGDVTGLPKPWKFVETFLFNEQRKFKPRTLD